MKKICFCLFLSILFSCSNESHNSSYESIARNSKKEVIGGTGNYTYSWSNGKKEEKAPLSWKRTNKTANAITLFIGDKEQLPLKGAQIAVKVDGFRARVLIDGFFYNDRERQLEGTFKMTLPQGASPYYFAFGESVVIDKSKKPDDIPFLKQDQLAFSAKKIEEMRSKSWSAPKVARVVQKEKAAFAYGQTVRRSVDPALAEWAGADVFNCRVFPLLPQKLHRVVFGYDVNLTELENDLIFNFPIPQFKGPLVIDVDIAEIDGVNCSISPKISTTKKDKRQTFRLTNPQEKEITIRYSDCDNLVLQNPANDKQTSYFAASVLPELPTFSRENISNRAIIALDVSLSSNPDKFNVWLKLTEAILLNNQNEIRQFNVLLFNVESFWWKEEPIENNADNVQRFIAYANQIVLEGASDLNLAISSISSTAWAKAGADNIFLMSDGSDTWGEDDPYQMVKNIDPSDRLFAYNTGMSGVDISNLTHFARASGGAFFSVTGEDEVQKASTAFRFKPWKIDQITIPGTSDILIAGRPEYLYAGQKLFISGRGTISKNATINLKISQQKIQENIAIDVDKSIESELTRRTYGQMATTILEEFDYATKKKSIAYAKHFNVPGKTCALLMLETEEDYKSYNITATEDAYLVKSLTVNAILDKVFKDLEQMLGNAKTKFSHWLTRLTTMDGMEFTVPASMEVLLDKIPEENFTVTQQALTCKTKLKKDIPKALLDSLLKPQLDYDQITKEAERRLDQYGSVDALKVLSSLVEKNTGNSVLSRDVAYSALNWGLNEQAYYLFKRVLETRPYEPQTYLAIAKSLAKANNVELSLLYYEIAITAKWDDRFGEFRKIAALDYLQLLGQLKEDKRFRLADYAQSRFATLRSEFKEEYADLMFVISWNTDNTDIDLHVIEPTGEECYYQNRKTKIGGRMTQDVTQGYGPEMYILQEAKKGKYKVKVKYFSTDRNRTTTRTKVYATIYENWGKENESIRTKVVSLLDNKEMHNIMTVDLKYGERNKTTNKR